MALGAQVAAATAFIDPEVLALGREALAGWEATEPKLATYEHYFDDLFRLEAHMRSARGRGGARARERCVLRPVSGLQRARRQRPRRSVRRSRSDGASLDVTQGTIDEIRAHPDRALRRSGWESYADGYLGVQNALAATLGTAVKQAVFSTRVRRHTSTLSASLTASKSPSEVFDNLIDAFEANLPTWHRYWGLRREVLGVERLAPYDVAAPLGELAARVHLRAERRVDLRVACAARRRVRRDGQARLPRGAVGRRRIRPPGRWAMRSLPERPEPRRSS